MMYSLRWLHWQITDLLTGFLVPALCAPLPAGLVKSIHWRLAGRAWLFPGRYQSATRSAERCFGEAGEIPRSWAWTTLMEATETWRLLLGLGPRLEVDGEWPQSPGFVAASMHYGIGTVVLWHLRKAGLSPRFVFRPVKREDMPGRPVLLAWYRLRTRLIGRLCPNGPITTGGAREQIEQALTGSEDTPVILFDAPVREGARWWLTLGRARMGLRGGGVQMIESSGARAVFFDIHIDRASGRTRLRIRGILADQALGDALAERMQAVLSTDPGQWLLWHGIEGLFEDPGAAEQRLSDDPATDRSGQSG